MATASASVIDVKETAKGIGTIKEGPGYSRIVVGGKTLAYVKRRTVSVPVGAVKRAPKKLARFSVEKNGKWASVRVGDTAEARRILEYVSAQQKEAK